jgi:hypothetical protein
VPEISREVLEDFFGGIKKYFGGNKRYFGRMK